MMKLQSCTARCLGKAIPTGSVDYPDIIHDPLRDIYSPAVVKRHDLLARRTTPVTIEVFGSGIAVQERRGGELVNNWYPIENFYCSAGVVPDKGGKTRSVVFKGLQEKCRSPGQPIFAMVVRQPDSEGRRVLMCHAFLMDNNRETQKLVSATKEAYQNKAGWSSSGNDKEFLNAKLSYTVQKLNEQQENNIDHLKVLTEKREKQLSQKPKGVDFKTQPGIQKVQQSQTMATHHSLPQTQSMVVRRPPSVKSMKVRSAPQTPRTPRVVAAPVSSSVVVASVDTNVAPQSLRVPTERAKVLYQGFNTETLNSQSGKATSDIGYQSNVLSNNEPGHATFLSSLHGFQSTYKRNWAAETPRGHRILASSVPQEVANDFNNLPNSAAAFQTDTNGHIEPIVVGKKAEHSKYHRPSKKVLEKYLQQGDDEGRLRSSSQQVSLLLNRRTMLVDCVLKHACCETKQILVA